MPAAVSVEVQGLGSVKGDVTVTMPVMCRMLFLLTVKSSDSVKGDITVTEPVQGMCRLLLM